jgi:branched-chain amino acid transport system ATP-binding protein
MLEIEHLQAGYFGSRVLEDVSLVVDRGVTVVLGPNGAGKSTLLKAISGTLRPVKGAIRYQGRPLERLPAHRVARLGLSICPERSRLFGSLRVSDNLWIGLKLARLKGISTDPSVLLRPILDLFPALEPRLDEKASQLSGGFQQALSIARALASQPGLLLMDEPTTGLHPRLAKDLLDRIRRISRDIPVLLTEQNARMALQIGDWAHLLENGHFVLSGSASSLLQDERVRKSYLGVSPAGAFARSDGEGGAPAAR